MWISSMKHSILHESHKQNRFTSFVFNVAANETIMVMVEGVCTIQNLSQIMDLFTFLRANSSNNTISSVADRRVLEAKLSISRLCKSKSNDEKKNSFFLKRSVWFSAQCQGTSFSMRPMHSCTLFGIEKPKRQFLAAASQNPFETSPQSKSSNPNSFYCEICAAYRFNSGDHCS